MKLSKLLVFATLFSSMVFLVCDEFDLDEEMDEHMRAFSCNQSVPHVIKRTFKEWSKLGECYPERLRSSEASVTKMGLLRYIMKSRIAKRRKAPLINVELRIELFGITTEISIQNRTYEADIVAFDSRISAISQASPLPIITGNLVELSFDITEFYVASKNLGRNNIRFKLKLHRKAKKSAKEFRQATVKAFVILYEKDDSCGSYLSKPRLKKSDVYDLRRSPQFLLKNGIKMEPACRLKDWYVSFADVGWSHWVIYPGGARVNSCRGSCIAPRSNTAGHALIQINYAMTKGKSIHGCCVPVVMGPLTMVTYDIMENVIVIKTHPDMIARECGCL